MEQKTGFFITAYGSRKAFLEEALAPVAAQMGTNLHSLDMSKPGTNLHKELDEHLLHALFVVVDFTPPGIDSAAYAAAPAINANVMFELGRILERPMPRFLIVDQAIGKLEERLPFDIRHFKVEAYRFSPSGLKELTSAFQDFLSQTHLRTLERTQPLFDQMSSIYAGVKRLVREKEDAAVHLDPLVRVLLDRMDDYTKSIERNSSMPCEIKPLSRGEMVNRIFGAYLDALSDGDSYDAVSTVDFARHLNRWPMDRELKFIQCCRRKVKECDVKMSRLVLVAPSERTEKLSQPDREWFALNERLAADPSKKFRHGYLALRSEEEYKRLREDLHAGVFRRANSRFVVKPEYENRPSRAVVSLKIIRDARSTQRYLDDLEQLWEAEKSRIRTTWKEIWGQGREQEA